MRESEKFQSHVEMVLQISHCVQPKVPRKKATVRKTLRKAAVGKILRELCVPTVGLDEAVILGLSIRNQEEEEKHQEQQNLRGLLAPFRMVEAPSRGLHQTTRFAGW